MEAESTSDNESPDVKVEEEYTEDLLQEDRTVTDLKDESSEDASANGTSSKDDSSQDESLKEESSKDASANDTSSKDHLSKDVSPQDDSSKGTSSKDVSQKDDASKGCDESAQGASSKIKPEEIERDIFSSPGGEVEDTRKEPDTPKVKKPWVFLADGQAYRKKLKKQFAEKPMTEKRCRNEILVNKMEHRVAVYPVSSEAMADPALLRIFERCTQVHVMYHHICSQNDNTSTLMGFLQLWFKRASDIGSNLPFLRLLGGRNTKIFYHAQPNKSTYSEFQAGWKQKYEGTPQTTMLAPFLPESITEDKLWNLFPLAEEITVHKEAKSSFKYAYVSFQHKESLMASIDRANEQNPRKKLRSLHLIPVGCLIQQTEAQHGGEQSSQQKDKPATQGNKNSQKANRQNTEKQKLGINQTLGPKKMSKKTKVVVSAINKRFQQNKPPSFSTLPQRRYRTPTNFEEDEAVATLSSLLTALGPRAPKVIDTIAHALDEQPPSMADHGSQGLYSHDPFGSDQVQFQPSHRGRGRGRGMPYYSPPTQQMFSNESQPGGQRKRQAGATQGQGRSHSAGGQQQNQKGGNQQRAQSQHQARDQHRGQQQNQSKSNRKNPGQQQEQAYLSLMGGNRRGRGRGLLRYQDESAFGNNMSSPFMGGRGKRQHFDQAWVPNQNFSSVPPPGNYEDWDGDYGQSFNYNHGSGDEFSPRGYDFTGSIDGQANYNFGISKDMNGGGQRNMTFGNKPYGGSGYK